MAAADSLDEYELRLALIPGVGPRTRRTLVSHLGSPEKVLRAPLERLQGVPGVGPVLGRRICAQRNDLDLAELLETCQAEQIAILLEGHASYPVLLREIPDPPGVLFIAGDLRPEDALSIAIVGTRHATPYGLRQAERLASELVRAGMTVVSGLARGIDAAAHRGALRAGGRTLAVLAGGLLRLYPPEHRGLADQIRRQGAVISEAPPLRPPSSGNFPQRNRIITGLALGVVVIEAGSRSGALISARHALEQGREVFAMPGQVDSPVSRGCHRLLREGAKLVESIDDILEEVGALTARVLEQQGAEEDDSAESPPGLSDDERAVWQGVGSEPTAIDDVIRSSGLPAGRVLAMLSVFELRRLIERTGGAYVQRAARR